MLKRTITGIIFVLVIFPIYLFSGTIVLPIAVSLLSVIGVYEMLGCIGTRKILRISIPAYLLAALVPQTVRLFSSRSNFLAVYMLLLFAYLMYLLTAGVFSHTQLDLEKLAISCIGVVYVVTSFLCMILLRDRAFGIYIFFMGMFGPWGSDMLAYFSGRLFGRHKLIPDVSPKKTVEGSIGGALFCGIAAVTFGYVVSCIDPSITEIRYLRLFVAGLIISIVSQIGDLIASYIKRKYEVKDYGNILPGHGGILDRFDSVLTTMPVMVMMGEIPHIFDFFG